MKVAIYSRSLDPEHSASFMALIKELTLHKIQPVVHQRLMEDHAFGSLVQNWARPFSGYEDLEEDTECMISLGGDGTLLDAAAIIRNKDIPLLGVNFGRLGFLAPFNKNDFKKISHAISNRQYIIDRRALLHLETDIPVFGDTSFALNEFVIHRSDTTSMIKVHTYLNGEFLNTYWADGIIMSTPTGSTGYNLSCNGPILFPHSQVFVLTPIAPHNLNVRPIVISDENIVSFEVESRHPQFQCSLDSRREVVDSKIQMAVRREDFDIQLIRFTENTFLETLRTKLTWGMDVRN